MKRLESDNLDILLAGRLKKAVGGAGRRDWRDVRRRAGAGKLWNWSSRRVLVVTGALVIAVGAAGASTDIIPWLKEEPKQVPPPEYPVCGAGDVEAKMFLTRAPKSEFNPKEGLTGTIILVNTGEQECVLEGDPKISLVGPGADDGRMKVELFDEVESVFSPRAGQNRAPWNADQTLIGRVYKPLEKRSSITLWWENWCGPGSGSDGYDGKPSLRIEIPNGTTLELPVYRLPGCIDAKEPSVLRMDQAKPAMPPPQPSPPLRAEILAGEQGEPLRLKAGETFHFTIGLTNTSDSTFRFDECPTYYEGLHLGGSGMSLVGAGNYVLNCRSVDAIAPGQTVTFAMEITPFEEIWGGEGELIWQLGPERIDGRLTSDPPTAKAAFVIEPEPTDYSPADVYSVFAPSTSEATLPEKVEKNARMLANQSSTTGPIVAGSRRILMEGPGPEVSIYAFATESGKACYFIGYGASCDGGEKQKAPITWITSARSDGPIVVGGLVRDGVAKIEIIVDGEARTATLGKNAFYLEIPYTGEPKDAVTQKMTGIRITNGDGSQETLGPDDFGCMKGGCSLG